MHKKMEKPVSSVEVFDFEKGLESGAGFMLDRGHQQRKALILFQIFKDRVSKREDSILSIQELLNFLDNRCTRNAKFDKKLANQIFNKVGAHQTGSLSVKDFVRTYLEAEEILKGQLDKNKIRYSESVKARDDCLIKLEEAKKIERVNEYRIMIDSKVYINLIDVEEVNADLVYVNFICESKSQKSEQNTTPFRVSHNPFRDETFEFEIVTGKESLLIQVFNNKNKRILGEAALPVKNLGDQNEQDQILSLQTQNGERKGKIWLKLRWIHSNIMLLESNKIHIHSHKMTGFLKTWVDEIESAKRELETLQNILEQLYEPFENELSQQHIKLFHVEDISFSKLDRKGKKRPDVNVPSYKLCENILYLFLLLGLFSMFHKPEFINICLGIGCYYILVVNKDELLGKIIRKLNIVVCASIVFDLIWLYSYNHMQKDQSPERIITLLTASIAYIMFFLKILMGVVFWKLSKEWDNYFRAHGI